MQGCVEGWGRRQRVSVSGCIKLDDSLAGRGFGVRAGELRPISDTRCSELIAARWSLDDSRPRGPETKPRKRIRWTSFKGHIAETMGWLARQPRIDCDSGLPSADGAGRTRSAFRLALQRPLWMGAVQRDSRTRCDRLAIARDMLATLRGQPRVAEPT